jgi:hypothetical protein
MARSPGNSIAVVRHRSGGTAIDADHLRDVWPLLAGTNPKFVRFAPLDGVYPALTEDAP